MEVRVRVRSSKEGWTEDPEQLRQTRVMRMVKDGELAWLGGGLPNALETQQEQPSGCVCSFSGLPRAPQ